MWQMENIGKKPGMTRTTNTPTGKQCVTATRLAPWPPDQKQNHDMSSSKLRSPTKTQGHTSAKA